MAVRIVRAFFRGGLDKVGGGFSILHLEGFKNRPRPVGEKSIDKDTCLQDQKKVNVSTNRYGHIIEQGLPQNLRSRVMAYQSISS